MKGRQRHIGGIFWLVGIGAAGVCIVAWCLAAGGRREMLADRESSRVLSKKLDLSKAKTFDGGRTKVHGLSPVRHINRRLAHQKTEQEEPGVDVGEGDVIAMPILKGTSGEQEVRRELAPLRDSDEASFLGAMQAMMRNEEADRRINALKVIGILYSGESAPAEAGENDDRALDEESKRTRGIVGIIQDGLHDVDANVRMQAIKTARRVEGDAAGIIAMQVMNGGDGDMKIRFLQETVGKATDSDMSVSLMGMSSPEMEVRSMAASNLKDLTGVDFHTSEDAQEWWEKNHIAFLAKAGGIPADANVAEAVGPSGADESSNDAVGEDLSVTDKEQTNNKRKE